MKIKSSFCISLVLFSCLIVSTHSQAQTPDSKLEVGAQVTSLTLFRPDGFGDFTEMGFVDA